MNAVELEMIADAHALADCFGHGWASFAKYTQGDLDEPVWAPEQYESIGAYFSDIDALMDIDDKRYSEQCRNSGHRTVHNCGLRPSLTHQSASKRFVWDVTQSHTLVAVCRPLSTAITFNRPRGGEWGILFDVGVCEPRHIEAGRWVAAALGIEEQYRAEMPVPLFHEWLKWSKEQ